MKKLIYLTVLIGLLLVGCGSENCECEGGGNNDASLLIGSWERVDNDNSYIIEFYSNGTGKYTYDEELFFWEIYKTHIHLYQKDNWESYKLYEIIDRDILTFDLDLYKRIK
ncbi:MAG: hypothetical protein LBH98_01285 [Chitinispirillales bacterium]|jgi:hypothetical protein|nr:hypothetical protein [Chitinispirillales bacterium]